MDRVGELARELGARCVLVVTDPGIVTAGHAHHVERSLQAAGIGVVIYDRARENPTTREVPIIFLTAMLESEDNVLRSYGTGAVDLLFKPFQLTDFLEAVETLRAA